MTNYLQVVIYLSDAGPLAPPMFGRSFNPIPPGEDRLSPPITTGTLNVFHLPASMSLFISYMLLLSS